MNNRTIPLITVAVAAAWCVACSPSESPRQQSSAAPAASSQSASASAPRSETRYADQNRDGKVTRDEARADPYLAASFDRYDGDHNESLDRAEFARLEADAMGTGDEVAQTSDERHQLRPRNEFPRPLQ